jgi:carbon monoxide dehydrogenase subunit G
VTGRIASRPDHHRLATKAREDEASESEHRRSPSPRAGLRLSRRDRQSRAFQRPHDARLEYAGPDRGVGSKARVKVGLGGGRTDLVEIETIGGERPARIVEQNTGAGGRRVANGTYALEELASSCTRVTFEHAWQRAPRIERLLAPLVRSVTRRRVERAMERLAEQLAGLQRCDWTASASHLDA